MPTRRQFLIPLAVAVLLSGLAACLEPPTAPGITKRKPGDENATWLLFIGNSHTEVNDIPGMVVAIAEQAGDSSLRADMIVGGGMALEDHWYFGDAHRALEAYRWDYVILQQGPSSLIQNWAHLRTWTEAFAPLIRAAEAEPVLYQVWPAIWRRQDAANALHSYTQAAAAVDGILAPAGDGITAAIALSDSLSVYLNDGVHASPYGGYIAALTIAARLVAFDPESLPPEIPGWIGAPPETVRLLQRAAATALARNPARP